MKKMSKNKINISIMCLVLVLSMLAFSMMLASEVQAKVDDVKIKAVTLEGTPKTIGIDERVTFTVKVTGLTRTQAEKISVDIYPESPDGTYKGDSSHPLLWDYDDATSTTIYKSDHKYAKEGEYIPAAIVKGRNTRGNTITVGKSAEEETVGEDITQAQQPVLGGGVGSVITGVAAPLIQSELIGAVKEKLMKVIPGITPEKAGEIAEKTVAEEVKKQTTQAQTEKPGFWTRLWAPANHIIVLHAKAATEALTVVGSPKAVAMESAANAATAIEIMFTTISIIHGSAMAGTLAYKVGRCYPEEPLADDKCKTCNEFGMFCTEERCRILGRNCVPVATEDANRMLCLQAECSTKDMPKSFPDVTELKVTAYVDRAGPPVLNKERNKVENMDVLNEEKGAGTLPWNTTILDLYVKAEAKTSDDESKETLCRWGFEPGQKFGDMDPFEPDMFALDHSMSIDLSGLTTGQNYTVYVKCRDACGAMPAPEDNPFWFKFALEKEPDFVYPCYPDMATAHEAGKCFIDPWQAHVPADLKQQKAQFWLNEPGECRYSLAEDNFTVAWDDMRKFTNNSHEMIIKGECAPGKCLGLAPTAAAKCAHCNLIFDLTKGERINLTLSEEELGELNLSEKEMEDILGLMDMFQYKGEIGLFHVVVVCRDDLKNEMPPLDYSILTMPPYNITIITPPVEDEYERHPEIEVNTTHNTQCKYQVNKTETPVSLKWDKMSWIDEDYAMAHFGEVEKELIPAGTEQDYTIYVKCRDEGKLEIDESKTFTVKRDIYAPEVIRLYHAADAGFGAFGNNLVIETNEPADCVYGIIGCDYNFSNGNAFTKDPTGYLQSAPWQVDYLYYVKCRDKWDNYPGPHGSGPEYDKCTAIVSPYEIPAM